MSTPVTDTAVQPVVARLSETPQAIIKSSYGWKIILNDVYPELSSFDIKTALNAIIPTENQALVR
jgi:hypothetical protein